MASIKYCNREWEILDELAFQRLFPETDENKDGLSGIEAFDALVELGIVKEITCPTTMQD
jgi:hypothetical protein